MNEQADSKDEILIKAADFFLLLGVVIEERRAAFSRRVTLAFAIVDDAKYVVDTGAKEIVTQGWRDNADVSVICNQRTRSDFALGRFDPQNPKPEHLFLFSGDQEVFGALASALSGGKSALMAHLDSLKKREKIEVSLHIAIMWNPAQLR